MYELQRLFLQGVLASAIMHLGCYQYFTAALFVCTLLWSQCGQHGCTFFSWHLSATRFQYLVSTGNQVRWNISEQTFPAGRWEFQTVWNDSISKETTFSYFSLPKLLIVATGCLTWPCPVVIENLQWVVSWKAGWDDGSLHTCGGTWKIPIFSLL